MRPDWQQTSALVGLMLGFMSLVLLMPGVVSGMEPCSWGWAQGVFGLLVIMLALAALSRGKWLPLPVILVLAVVGLVVIVWMRTSGIATSNSAWALMTAYVAVVLGVLPKRQFAQPRAER